MSATLATQLARTRGQWALAGILIIAAGLRFWGLAFGLPHDHCRPDEVTLAHHALSIGAGDLNPHFFNYPTLHFYLLAIIYGAYFVCGYALGAFSGVQDFELAFFLDPSPLYLLGRSFSAILGTISIWLVYRIGNILGDRSTGLTSALFLAISFLHVRDSHFATTDIPGTCYFLASCALALRYGQTSINRDLYLGAVFLGLAASTKYNLAIFAVVVVISALQGPGPVRHTLHRLFIAVIFMTVTFLFTSPYIALDFATFWRDLTYERTHFYLGHGIDLGRGWLYHLQYTLPHGLGWPLFAFGLIGALRWGARRRPAEWALLAGLLGYYIVAGSGKSVFYRYAIPLLPLLCIAAGSLISAIARTPLRTVLAALVIAAPTAWASYNHSELLAQTDTRVLAARWIEQHVPPETKIARCCSPSLYGHPQLRLAPAATKQRRTELSRAGYSFRRWLHLDALAARARRPGYDLVELVRGDLSGYSWAWSQYDIDRLRIEQVEWVVIQEHPQLIYSNPDPSLTTTLQHYKVKTFDPFTGTANPIYDPIDAFYLPVAGFDGISRPGPKISIYRLDAP
jgi:hypothetical protein